MEKIRFFRRKITIFGERLKMSADYLKDIDQDLLENLPKVEEAAATYLYISKNRNDMEFISSLKKLIGINLKTLARWLNITPRTFKNYQDKKHLILKDNLKEHIVMLLSLYKHGAEVFGTVPTFETWLSGKNRLLDNRAPSDFLDTISGIRFIDGRLTALEYGENA